MDRGQAGGAQARRRGRYRRKWRRTPGSGSTASPEARLNVRGLFALAIALTLATTGCQLIKPSQTQSLQGKIAWPKDSDLWVYDLNSKQQTRIVALPQGGAVTGVAWSPDGQRVIYAQFWRRPNERSSGADLMIANADGSNAHPFAERDAPNTVLEAPQWATSGLVYYTVPRGPNSAAGQSLALPTQRGEPRTPQRKHGSPTTLPPTSKR